jgi:hypothetical protein
MSSLDAPGATTTNAPGRLTLIFGATHLALGTLSVGLAALGSERGVVHFSSEVWRMALGASGAALVFFGLRSTARVLRRHRYPFDEAALTRRRVYGGALFLTGAGLFAAAASEGGGVTFGSWASVVYMLGGLHLIACGLGAQVDPSGIFRKLRAAEGEGIHTTAIVAHAEDRGTLRGQAKARVELDVEVNGSVERRSALTVLDRGLLARIEGATVDVVVDPSDPAIFDVRWDTLREAPRAKDAR